VERGVAHLKVDFTGVHGCPILTAQVNQQHPPAHHVRWMWFGQETLKKWCFWEEALQEKHCEYSWSWKNAHVRSVLQEHL